MSQVDKHTPGSFCWVEVGTTDARLAKARELRARFAEALSRIHATLEPAQRERLAELVRHGGRRHGCGRWGARTA